MPQNTAVHLLSQAPGSREREGGYLLASMAWVREGQGSDVSPFALLPDGGDSWGVWNRGVATGWCGPRADHEPLLNTPQVQSKSRHTTQALPAASVVRGKQMILPD